jgi:hypothetical protein
MSDDSNIIDLGDGWQLETFTLYGRPAAVLRLHGEPIEALTPPVWLEPHSRRQPRGILGPEVS